MAEDAMTGDDCPAGLPPAVPAAVWMLLGCLCFSSMNGIVRHLSQQELPTLVIVFFRSLFGLLAMLPWLLRPGLASLRPGRIDLHTLRVALALVAMVAWFYGLGLMPLAEATALSFTTPLFASIAAVLILGEVMRARRWTAILVGFAGAMIILRPGFAEFTTATACVLGAALLMAISQTVVKLLAPLEHANATVFWLVLMMTPLSLLAALFDWQTPTLSQLAWLLLLGVVATLGHQALARALRGAEATALYPLDFTRLVFASAIGYLAFAEAPDSWTWIGAAVIVSSSVYIARREAVLRRRSEQA
jgi:drug/metabolite transporter (DMT)-like permease